ncbi:hypothetical protein Thi970DRAFT_04098 [Thiorhodovibrio frisius]|uniref:Uncharacterized protein n=2 Tax=Thiorhodovibrio frisius TaxID=631362 RepID=H8Z554_9GAMM|nr:hypothetical protein Thi970DRAFT_04098 [Thiorhodovibrio frisius]WPL21205.1 hypothetical protein Thiofri_01316 [Thiorhodovibrio frisius]
MTEHRRFISLFAMPMAAMPMALVPMALMTAAAISGCATTQRQEPPAPIVDARVAPAPTNRAEQTPEPTTPPEPARIYAYQPVTTAPPAGADSMAPGAASAQTGAAENAAGSATTPAAALPATESPAQLPADANAEAAGNAPAVVGPGSTTPALPAPETQLASASALQTPQLAPAVDALAKQAEGQRQSGDYAGAAATLERALRLQSREGYLWNRLAHVRLEQGLASQAANLAARANALSGDSDSLKRDNWLVISDARRRTGDLEGAQEAQRKASGG